ncbi:MAG TPA: PLP-dependent aspartate aminotransferase family protein [Sporichthya sp.]|nr:PLP-dependent aspartate aminotransferase family protein [Sporichthya sp.]
MPLSPETVAVHAGRPPRELDAPLNQPPVFASVYNAGGPMDYGRHGNPTWAAFEAALGALEGGHGVAFPSGLAAVAGALSLVRADAVVVAPQSAYLGTLGQFGVAAARTGLQLRLVDSADTDEVVAACDGADLLLVESPTNPALEVADLPAVCAAGRAAGALVVVDNTFATPFGQRPIEVGADVVLHSATKFIAGHSDVVLGVLVCADDAHVPLLTEHRRLSGSVPGVMECWLALRGLRTLHLRVQRATANAAVIAPRLAAHPVCRRVRYPGLPTDPGHVRAAAQMSGFGSILSAEFQDAATADQLCASTRLWVNATSLGAVESTLERRRRWSGESPTIPPGLVRLSVGIEDPEDLWADLEQALDAL